MKTIVFTCESHSQGALQPVAMESKVVYLQFRFPQFQLPQSTGHCSRKSDDSSDESSEGQ